MNEYEEPQREAAAPPQPTDHWLVYMGPAASYTDGWNSTQPRIFDRGHGQRVDAATALRITQTTRRVAYHDEWRDEPYNGQDRADAQPAAGAVIERFNAFGPLPLQ